MEIQRIKVVDCQAYPPTLEGINIRERQAMVIAAADYRSDRNRLDSGFNRKCEDIRADFAKQRDDYLRDLRLARREHVA